MTLDDLLARETIRHTMACYNQAGDRLQADEFAAQFTDDAVLESKAEKPSDQFRHEGKAAIREWMATWSERAARTPDTPRPTFVRHHLSTCTIELTSPTTAKARTYWVAYTDIGADHGGTYTDSFRKQGDRWLIAHRLVRLDWRAPNSLFSSGPPRAGHGK